MLSVSNLKISFEDNHVLDGFNLDLDSGDIFALLGDSGSGKSSALRFIAGLEKAQLGSVALDGNDLSSDGSHSVKPELREIGMVFQDYSLFPHMTVFDNISFGINHLSKKEKIKEVEKLLELISLEGIEKNILINFLEESSKESLLRGLLQPLQSSCCLMSLSQA